LELYRLIDWLLVLPEGLARQFKQQLMSYEQSQVMPYVSSIERTAKEEGHAEGRAEGHAEGRASGSLQVIEKGI
jgi:flagellar biosynthesis/type III secretory pathway protein FliH